MSNTLVIHPADPTTDFLKYIYVGKEYDVITKCDDDNEIRKQIAAHDRIIMLGHGTGDGLIKSPYEAKFIINDSHADLLREKETISIWCYSDKFFRRNNLHGFHTGMIISETLEAQYVLGRIPLTSTELAKNMDLFSVVCRDAIEMNPEQAVEYVLKNYVGTDDITSFNRRSIVVT